MARRLFRSCFGRGSSTSSSSSASASKQEKVDATVPDVTEEELRRGGPIVVELFSSQGCATSPQAELLFSRIGRGDFNLEKPVTLLAYHVDYWDYMGWKDPFGSSLWTVRQKAYVESLQLDSMFTPQIVVQGRAQCAGNDEDAVLSLLKSAPSVPTPAFQATFQKPTPETLEVTLNGALRTKVDSEGVDIMVALYETGLVTNCDKGENKDKVLANDYVVRGLEKLCSLRDIPAKKTVSGSVKFSLWQSFNSSKCGVAVFAENGSHQIFGSQSIKLPNDL